MPTTVTSSSGQIYHLWQLPALTTPEPSESIEFNVLSNDLANGYRSRLLFGSNTGLRSWTLKVPTLASLEVLSNTVTGINGEAVSREQYLWDLYCETKVTGEPFVYTSPRNGQYYLVEFADEKLTYEQMRVKIYSTGIELRQVRISGETVFDISACATTDSVIMTWLKGADYNDGTSSWVATEGGSMAGVGDVDKETAVQNGLDIVRFSDTTNDGYVGNGLDGITVHDAFLVMKMREASFSNDCGIFTGAAGSSQIILGSAGTTKFQNPSLSATAYSYRLNGIEYEQTNLQAPMNTWGVVHVRYTTGWALAGADFQFGKDRGTAGTFAEMDLGEVVVFSGPQPMSNVREITEALIVKWGIV